MNNMKQTITEDSITYLYLFPELTDEDLEMLKAYGLRFEGKNHGATGDEDNWVVTGSRAALERYAEKWLGYELHPGYLYEYDDFAGDIVNEAYEVEENMEELEINDDSVEGIVTSDKKICESFEDVTIEEVVDWLSEHDTAYEDAQMYFSTNDLEELDKEEIISWISNHDQLYDDFKIFFKDKLTLDEAVGRPSQATLDDCLEYYRNNASGYDGVEDYVDTEFPMHSQEFKAEVVNYIKERKDESLSEGVVEPQPNGYHNMWPITDTIVVHNDGGVYHVVEKQGYNNTYIFSTENIEELNNYLSSNYGETIVDPEPKEKPVEEPKKRYPLHLWKAIEDAVAGMNNIPVGHKEAFISLVGDRATTKRIPNAGWKSSLLPVKLRAKYGERANYNHLILSPEHYGVTLEQALTDIYDTMKVKWFNESLLEEVKHCWFGYYLDVEGNEKYFYMTKDSTSKDPDEASEIMEDSIPEPFTKFVFQGSVANTQAEKQGMNLVEGKSIRESTDLSITKELDAVYNDVLDTLYEGSNADLVDNIKKVFTLVGGNVNVQAKSDDYIEYQGSISHDGQKDYRISGSVLRNTLKGDLNRLAEDLTMAYYRTKLGGQLYNTPELMKKIKNYEDILTV